MVDAGPHRVGSRTLPSVPSRPEPAGCRSAALATSMLIGLSLSFMAIGLTLVNQVTCEGTCETLAVTLLFAGLPVSAIVGVSFGDLVVAWPLDMTLWVVIGFLMARHADNRGRNVLGWVVITLIIALTYGLVLSLIVEIDI